MKIEKHLKKIQDETTSSSGMVTGIDTIQKKKKNKLIKDVYNSENITKDYSPRRVMIDLDGTIHKYSKGFQDGSLYDQPFQGAKDVIDWLKEKGYEIVIFSTRASEENAKETGDDHVKQIQNIQTWLTSHNIYYDRVTAEKIFADFYIDDRAITIKNGNWNDVKNEIQLREKKQ